MSNDKIIVDKTPEKSRLPFVVGVSLLTVVAIFMWSKFIASPGTTSSSVSSTNEVTKDYRQGGEANQQQVGSAESLSNNSQLMQQHKQVLVKEKELESMALEYELLRDDPEKKRQHRAEMQRKLSEYSEDLIPVVMAKLESSEKK